MGGEKIIEPSLLKIGGGSPPRRRGKATVAVRVNVPVRITPAQAGKSRRGGFCYVWTRDHPRVGGEKPPGTRIQPPSTGSPPRGRGKVTLSYHHPFFFGITPAWAGKSFFVFFAVLVKTDHPRVGGEKFVAFPLHWLVPGSPPRGRGKVKGTGQIAVRSRITPAWAGKRRCISRTNTSAGDHPRVGGEKIFCLFVLL